VGICEPALEPEREVSADERRVLERLEGFGDERVEVSAERL
jgi:hypothetical protein